MILVPSRSSRYVDQLCLLLRPEPTFNHWEIKREGAGSLSSFFFLLFPFFLFLQFPLPPPKFGPTWSSGMSSLAMCHPLISSLGLHLSTYPHLWISFLLSGDTCPTWFPLRLLFDLSPFDTWINVRYPTKCHVSLATIGALKNVKF